MKKTWIPEFWWIDDKLVSADGESDSRMGHAIVVRQYVGQHVLQELGISRMDWDDAPGVRCGISDTSIAADLRTWLAAEEWPDERIEDDPWDAIDEAAARLPHYRKRHPDARLYHVWSDAVDATDFAVRQLGWLRVAGLHIELDTMEGTGKWRLQACVEALMHRYPAFYRPELHAFVSERGGYQSAPADARSLRLEELARGELHRGTNPPEFRPSAVRKLEKDLIHPYYRNRD